MKNFSHPIESILKGAQEANEDLFGGGDEQMRQAMEARIELSRDEQRAISSAWARFYRTPEGRKALELLFDTTLRRTVFFAQLGLTAEQIGVYGAFREGQNAVATEIARQIAIGAHEEEPKPREAGQ